jgi:hypothetical protein
MVAKIRTTPPHRPAGVDLGAVGRVDGSAAATGARVHAQAHIPRRSNSARPHRASGGSAWPNAAMRSTS